ncbi:DNA-processing protein DprA [Alkalibacterium sp.]
MLTENTEQLLFKIAHCPFLSYKEKWVLANEQIGNLAERTQSAVPLRRLTDKKKASFLRYESKLPIMQLNEAYHSKGIVYHSIFSPAYPEQLKHIFAPPLVLFLKGNESNLKLPMIGVVGARECSPYSKEVLQAILPTLIEEKVGIVSGLAKGVDGLAHQNTISLGGRTIGVVGTGLDYYYPSENKELQMRMERTQLVLSEYPLGTPPRRHHFPERNRIISGLSKGVVVIEAKSRSGSLITARIALEEGRDVFAVPGAITNPLSSGCHELLKDGALLCTDGNSILNEWIQ